MRMADMNTFMSGMPVDYAPTPELTIWIKDPADAPEAIEKFWLDCLAVECPYAFMKVYNMRGVNSRTGRP